MKGKVTLGRVSELKQEIKEFARCKSIVPLSEVDVEDIKGKREEYWKSQIRRAQRRGKIQLGSLLVEILRAFLIPYFTPVLSKNEIARRVQEYTGKWIFEYTSRSLEKLLVFCLLRHFPGGEYELGISEKVLRETISFANLWGCCWIPVDSVNLYWLDHFLEHAW